MLHLLTLALILFASGGSIAWMGDKLGTYVGKKRLSSFGLRPRHTAMLYTVASGGIIAVITLLIAIAIDSTYLMAIRHGAEIIDTNKKLSAQNLQFSSSIKDAESQLLVVEGLVSTAKSAEAAARRAQTVAQLQLNTAEHSLKRERDTLHDTEAKLIQSRLDLTSKKVALENAKQKVAVEEEGLHSATQLLFAAKSAVESKSIALSVLNTRLATEQQQFRTLSSRNRMLAAEYTKLSTQHVIFKGDQEIERTVISSRQPTDDIRNEMVTFLGEVARRASERGAVPGLTGNPIEIVEPSVGAQPESRSRTEELERESSHIEAIVQQIANASSQVESVVVLAKAADNSVVGQQLGITVDLYDNFLVYKEGDTIASATINGAQDGLVIFADLNRFFANVTRQAVLHKIIPHRNPDTGLPSVGGAGLNFTQIQQLVQQIHNIGGPAIITAKAKYATYSTGPVVPDLTVVAAPSSPSKSPAPPLGQTPQISTQKD